MKFPQKYEMAVIVMCYLRQTRQNKNLKVFPVQTHHFNVQQYVSV